MINHTDSVEAYKAVDVFLQYYHKAAKSDYIHKPVAWALYQTWKEIDKNEKPKEREQND